MNVNLVGVESLIVDSPDKIDTTTKPDVWTMPDEGIEWCDCGESHPVNKAELEELVKFFAEWRDYITHRELIEATMEFWGYIEVCEFFLMKLRDSATLISGSVKEKYPIAEGVDIIGYFSKTWQGCPEEVCDSAFSLDY